MPDQPIPAHVRKYIDALEAAVHTCKQLMEAGQQDRAAGLAVAVDLGTSAAFLFSLTLRDYENATNGIRQAIRQANRPPDDERGQQLYRQDAKP